jgi:ribulose 1,5-bisphosphate synthetase/thiazole synthase
MSAIPNVPESLHAQQESPHDAAQAYLLRNKGATTDRLKRVDSKTANGVINEAVPQWSVHDSPIENQRPIKVIVIGAGYSGIYLGIRLPERLRNCELVIYEKNKGVGGAWYVGYLRLYVDY